MGSNCPVLISNLLYIWRGLFVDFGPTVQWAPRIHQLVFLLLILQFIFYFHCLDCKIRSRRRNPRPSTCLEDNFVLS